MTKGLKTLIRLQKNKLDELHMVISKIEGLRQGCVDRIDALLEELDYELKMADDQAHLSQFFGDFQKRIQHKQALEEESIRRFDQQIMGMKQQMQVVYSELKKYEIAKQRADEEAKRKAEKREQDELDEIAGQAHQRKAEDV